MIKPVNRHYDTHRRTSILYFDDREPMDCYMRGGICWPVRYEINGQIETDGYALMAGQEITTGDIYVFEQIKWVTVDNIIGGNNVLQYPGLSHWFNRVWNVYYGQSYYYEQGYELSRRFRIQVSRSTMIEPKPRFIELPPFDISEMINCIWRTLKAKAPMIYREKDTDLETQLDAVQGGVKDVLPAVYALGCCVMGFELYPWRKPYDRPIQEMLVA